MIKWGAVVTWMAAIFAVSSMRGSNLPGGFSVQAHFIEYLVLAALLYIALRESRSPLAAALIAIAIASLYGVTDEIHQSFVPQRYPDPKDWLTDTIGASIGAFGALAAERLRAVRASRRREAGSDS